MLQILKQFHCPACTLQFTGKDGYRTYTNSRYPLVLKCGHTHCESCVNSCFKAQKSIRCSICDKVTEFEPGSSPTLKLLPDTHVLGILNVKQTVPSLKNKLVPAVPLKYDKKEGALVTCERCSMREASFRCKKCEENFCNICFDAYHHGKGKKKHHAAVPVYAESYHSLVQEGCSEHDNRPIEFYCEEDDMLTCSHCVITGSHRGHNVITLVEKNESCLEELKSVYNEALGFSKRVKFTEQKLSQTIPTDKVDCSQWVKEIRTQFHHLHNALLLRENELLQQIEDISNANISHITQLRQQVSDVTKDVEALLRDSVCAMENPTISISVPAIISKLAAVKDEPCHLLPVVDDEPKKEISLTFEEDVKSHIMEYGKISADVKPRFCLKGTADLPEDFIVEPLPQELISTADTESLISDTFSEDSLSPALGNGISGNLVSLSKPEPSPPKAKVDKVVVSHIVNPNCFFVRKCTDAVKLDQIASRIDSHIRSKLHLKNKSKPDSFEKGNIYLVCFTKDNRWYRGRILDIMTKPDISENAENEPMPSGCGDDDEPTESSQPACDATELFAKVYYIDFGNSEVVPLSQIKPIEREMLRYPDLAKKCCLYNIVPIKSDVWSLQAKTIFQEFVFEKDINMQVIEDRDGILHVDLCQLPCTGMVMDIPISVRDALIFLEYGSFFDEKELLKVKKIRKFRHYLPPEPVSANARASVNIVCVENPSMFYVQQLASSRHFSELLVEMQEVYSADTRLLHSVYAPYIGMICAAQLPDDQMWYRAEVLGLPGGAQVELEFVDFGYKQILHHKYLRTILDKFTKLNRQALPCTLADVSSASDVEWSEEAKDWLSECTKKKRFNLLSLGYETGSSKTKVVLYDVDGELETCINALMVEEKMAVSTGIYSTIVFKCREKPKTPTKVEEKKLKKKKKKNFLIEEPIQESANEVPMSVFYEAEPEFKPEPEVKLPKPKEQLPEHVKIVMSHVESPGVFHIRISKVEDTLQKLMEDMQETYKDFESSPVDLKIGKDFAAYRESDKTWYRAIIRLVDDDSVQVRFPDFGFIEKVLVKNLRPLLSKFEKEKAYSVCCHLSGCIPAGGSKKWPKVASDLFLELTSPHESLFLVHGDAEDDNKETNSLPTDIFFEQIIRGGALEPTTVRYTSVTKKLIDGGVALPVRKKKKVTPPPPVTDPPAPQISPLDLPSTSAQAINIAESSSEEAPVALSPEPKKPPRMPTIQWKPAEIPLENKFKAFGTNVGDDGSIFLQVCPKAESNAVFIKDTLQVKYENCPFVPVRIAPPIGEACIAQFDLDKKYYRAEIITDDPKKLKVQFIDYGNYEIVKLKTIQVATFLTDIPRQCIECELVNVDPPSGTWPSNVLNYIHSNIVEAYCDVEVVEPPEPGKRLKIQLNFLRGNLNSLVADIFYVAKPMQNGLDSALSNELLYGEHFQEATPLAIGGEPFPVCVTHIIDQTVVYLQYIPSKPPHSEVDAQRHKEVENFLKLLDHLNMNGCNFPLVTNPEHGMPCIGIYSGNWYRCIAIDVDEDFVTVRYVDYGNVERVPFNELRESDDFTLNFPIQAHLCKIKDLEPVADTWTEPAIMLLKNLIAEDKRKKQLYARVVSKSDIYEVELLEQDPDGNYKLVYEDLILDGIVKLHC